MEYQSTETDIIQIYQAVRLYSGNYLSEEGLAEYYFSEGRSPEGKIVGLLCQSLRRSIISTILSNLSLVYLFYIPFGKQQQKTEQREKVFTHRRSPCLFTFSVRTGSELPIERDLACTAIFPAASLWAVRRLCLAQRLGAAAVCSLCMAIAKQILFPGSEHAQLCQGQK